MAITVDWGAKIINVPKADTAVVSAGPPEIRSLSVDVLRLALKALEASVEGQVFDDTHEHNTEVLLSGLLYARVVRIINGYTLTFEPGAYTVVLTSANHNIADVQNQNGVGIVTQNSAGLINNSTELAEILLSTILSTYTAPGTFGHSALLALYRSQHGLAVYWDDGNGTAGQVPGVNGTYLSPCDTETDARAVADALGIRAYIFGPHAGFPLLLTLDHEHWSFYGQSEQGQDFPFLDVGGVSVDQGYFSHVSLSGDLGNSWINVVDSFVQDCTNVYGRFKDCQFFGNLVVSANVNILNCMVANASTTITPTLPAPLFLPDGRMFASFHDCSGNWVIGGSTHSGTAVTWLAGSGSVRLLATNTQGTFVIDGDQRVINETTPAAGLTIITNNQPHVLDKYNDGEGLAVHFDSVAGFAGQVLGVNGTIDRPSSNETDAKAIADALGIRAYVLRDGTFTASVDHTDWLFRGGVGGYFGFLQFDGGGGASFAGSKVEDLACSGDAGASYIWFVGALVNAVTNLQLADLWNCQLSGINKSNAGIRLLDCNSGFGAFAPSIEPHTPGSTCAVTTIRYGGTLTLLGIVGTGIEHDIGFAHGNLTLDATVTQGDFTYSGNIRIIDNTTPQAGLNHNFDAVTQELVDATLTAAHDAGSWAGGGGGGAANILGDFTIGAGATASVIPTDATQADNFFDGQLALITTVGGELVSRSVRIYSNAGGTFTLSPALPIVPSSGDNLKVIAWSPEDPVVVGGGVQ